MSHYAVYITPRAWKEIKDLPGNIRQRVKRAVEALAENPRPPYDCGDLGQLLEQSNPS